MRNIVTKNSLLKQGFVIRLLSFISLIFLFFSFISNILMAFMEPDDYAVRVIIRDPYFYYSLLLIVSALLLTLYTVKFHQKNKNAILIPIILLLVTLTYLIRLMLSLFDLILSIINITTFVCSIISALKGLKKKTFFILAISLHLLYLTLSFCNIFPSLRYYFVESAYLAGISYIIADIGKYCLSISLLLFGLKNIIPSIIAPKLPKEKIKKLSPEKELKSVQHEFNCGNITKEEYQARRIEILRDL